MADPEGPLPRRERVRASTIEEIKATARRLMAESGTIEARFTDIARAMGMTPPALYRYFADRDELLTALLTDGYNDLADRMTAAAGGPDDRCDARSDAWHRLTRVARAYRAWGHEDHARYALVFGMPIPGYAAPEEGETTMAAKRALSALETILADAQARGGVGPPLIGVHGGALMAHGSLHEAPPETHQAMMNAWVTMHGFVSLEIFGHLDMAPQAARDELYDAEVRLVALALGITPAI